MRRTLVLLATLALFVSSAPVGATTSDLLDDVTSALDVPEHHPTTVLVAVDDEADAELVHASVAVGEVANTIDPIGVDVVRVPEGTPPAAVAAYEAHPDVTFAELNVYDRLHGEPNDPEFPRQYQMDQINAVEGWTAYNEAVGERYAPSGGATIAILDSGIDLSHPEFAGKIDLETGCRMFLTGAGIGLPACQENTFHGTYVAGVAAAIADNDAGIAGVGFDSDLMVLQVCTRNCARADSAAAIVYAAEHEVDVTNMSFGGSAPESETRRRAIELADEAGVLQVSSAGNSGPSDDSVTYPSANPEVVTVGATNQLRRVTSFSSRGPEMEVTAPGEAILSTMPGAGLLYLDAFSGTSFSGPAVAGLGALLMNLGLDHEEARGAMGAGAVFLEDADHTVETVGHGIVDVGASIEIALDPEDERRDEPAFTDPGPPSQHDAGDDADNEDE